MHAHAREKKISLFEGAPTTPHRGVAEVVSFKYKAKAST